MHLGAFDIKTKLAEGGMGEVWSGVHTTTGTPVVAKVLTGEAVRHPKFLELFQLEVQATARLEHPNVISVFDFGALPAEAAELGLVPGSPYYVMEWVSGGSLVGQPWDYNALRNALLGMLTGLAHSHSRGILHLDMKPGNVLWKPSSNGAPRIVVTDFGLARAHENIEGIDDLTESLNAGATGTPAYMSPEQFMGAFRDFVPATDLYAVGVMAYEFACGQLPFEARNIVMLAQHHRNSPMPELAPRFEVPVGFDGWVDRLTQKGAGDRFGSAADAARALRALGGVTGGARTVHEPAAVAVADTLDASDAPTLITLTPEFELSPGTVSIPAASSEAPIPEDWREVSERWLPTQWLPPGRDLVQWKTPSLVARQPERDLLWSALNQVATESRVQTVILRGGLGTGKTRLARWLQELARLGGYARTATAYHDASNAAAHGLGGMLSDYFRCLGLRRDAVDGRMRARLAHHDLAESELEAIVDLMSRPTGDDAFRAQNVPQVQICKRALEREAAEETMVVLLDDLQWGRPALELIEQLSGARDVRLLLVGTVRDEALEPAVEELLETVIAHPSVHCATVDNLLPGEALTLAKEALSLTGSVANTVATSSRGNPLYATELVRHWIANGELVCVDNEYVLATDTPTMPSDIASLWSRSLDALVERLQIPRDLGDDRIAIPASEAAIRTRIEVAAALGVHVAGDEWGAVCRRVGAAPVFGLVDELVKIGFCTPTDDGFQFEHGLMRDALMEISREAGRWSAINLAVAETLESLHDPSTRGLLPRLAGHYLSAGALDDAERLIAMTFHRQGVFGYAASQQLRDLHKLFDRFGIDLDEPRWLDLWMLRGELLAMEPDSDQNRQGMALLQRAVEHTRAVGEPIKLGQALRVHGWCQVFGGDLELGIRELEESLELLTGHSEESLSATYLSLVHYYAGNTEALEQTARRGLRTAASPIQEFYAHQMLSYAAIGDYELALEHLARCLEIAQQYNMPDGLTNTVWGLGDAHFSAGEYALAAAEYQTYVDLAVFYGRQDRYATVAPEYLGRSLALDGHYRDALPHLLNVHHALLRGESAEGAGPADAILLCAAMLEDDGLAAEIFDEALKPPQGARINTVAPVVLQLLRVLADDSPLRRRVVERIATDEGWSAVEGVRKAAAERP